MKKHYQEIPKESLCWYCKNCVDSNICTKCVRKNCVYRNGYVYACNKFEQDIPFPIPLKDLLEKFGFLNINNLLTRYVIAEYKYKILKCKVEKIAYFYKESNPLDYGNYSLADIIKMKTKKIRKKMEREM